MTQFFPKKHEERYARQISPFPLDVFMAGEKNGTSSCTSPRVTKRKRQRSN